MAPKFCESFGFKFLNKIEILHKSLFFSSWIKVGKKFKVRIVTEVPHQEQILERYMLNLLKSKSLCIQRSTGREPGFN